MWGQLIGGLVGTGAGLLGNALDSSKDDERDERIRQQRMALEALSGAQSYIPSVNHGSFRQAHDNSIRMAQHGAGGEDPRRAALDALARRKPEEEGY